MAFPEIILLDEPDASLHPSMVYSMLSVINDLFVKELGLKVIITTHSATTVALSPEESIYFMRRFGSERIIKISQDSAIAKLSIGVPTLSVKINNRYQVFVESENDEKILNQLYSYFKQNYISEISLNFIRSGLGDKGDCTAVKSLVKSLIENGNDRIYGIIDRDKESREPVHGHILILGQGKRYSIENFILDPFLIGFFILKNYWMPPERIGLLKGGSYIELVDANEDIIQLVTDAVLDLLDPPEEYDKTLNLCKYSNGKSVRIPNWYLNCAGHSLENMWLEKIKEFRRYGQEPKLKGELIRSVYPEMTGFVSMDIMDTFKRIIDHSLSE